MVARSSPKLFAKLRLWVRVPCSSHILFCYSQNTTLRKIGGSLHLILGFGKIDLSGTSVAEVCRKKARVTRLGVDARPRSFLDVYMLLRNEEFLRWSTRVNRDIRVHLIATIR